MRGQYMKALVVVKKKTVKLFTFQELDLSHNGVEKHQGDCSCKIPSICHRRNQSSMERAFAYRRTICSSVFLCPEDTSVSDKIVSILLIYVTGQKFHLYYTSPLIAVLYNLEIIQIKLCGDHYTNIGWFTAVSTVTCYNIKSWYICTHQHL